MKELAKFDVNKKCAGVGGMLDRIAEGGDFRKQSTYLAYNEDEDEDLHSDDDDAFAHDSDEEKQEKAEKAEKENQAENSAEKKSKSFFSFSLPKPAALQSTEVLLEQLMDSIVNESRDDETALKMTELNGVMDELLKIED